MSKILFVHPQDKVRDVITSMLTKDRHHVITAHDAVSALGAFEREKPDIVVLNQDLPKVPSFQIFSELRKADAAAHILIFALRKESETDETSPVFGIRALGPGEMVEAVETLLDSPKPRQPQAGIFPPRVLVVDDDPSVQSTLRRLLRGMGYEVAVASDGLEGLSLLKKIRPHLVLLDIDMPRMNGVITLKKIRRLDNQVGVMMVTGNHDVDMMQRCRDYGAYDYVLKPFNFSYLEFSIYSKILLMTL